MGDPADVIRGIEPDRSRQQGQQCGRRPLEADALALELGDIADSLLGEELEAADMEAGERDDRQPGLDRPRQRTEDKGNFEIDRSTRCGLDNPRLVEYGVKDVGKPFGRQQVFGDK